MNDDELWAAIDAQRTRTVMLLDDVTTAEWDYASLCDGWRIRDVAAHLTMQQMTLRDGLKGLLRHPGSLNHVIHATAVRKANRRPPEQFITEIRGTIGSRRVNVGLTPRETLLDIIVHGQDMAIPLRRQLEVPAKAGALTATHLWSYQSTRKGRWLARVFRPVPFRSYRLIATDTEWSVGAGPEICGPILAIVLLLSGRTAGYADLAGSGAAALGASLGLTRSA